MLLVCFFHQSGGYNELELESEDCRDRGECFSGAWFTLATHVQEAPMMSLYFNHYSQIFLKGKRRVTCEEASYFLFHKTQKSNRMKEFLDETNATISNSSSYVQSRTQDQLKKWGDYPRQSIDLLDFSVLHLSVAERFVLCFFICCIHVSGCIICIVLEKVLMIYNFRFYEHLGSCQDLHCLLIA